MAANLFSYFPGWDLWIGAFIVFIVPYGIARIYQWIRN